MSSHLVMAACACSIASPWLCFCSCSSSVIDDSLCSQSLTRACSCSHLASAVASFDSNKRLKLLDLLLAVSSSFTRDCRRQNRPNKHVNTGIAPSDTTLQALS